MDQQQHKTETEARSLKDGLLVFADRMKAAMDLPFEERRKETAAAAHWLHGLIEFDINEWRLSLREKAAHSVAPARHEVRSNLDLLAKHAAMEGWQGPFVVNEYMALPGDVRAFIAQEQTRGICCAGRESRELAEQDAQGLNAAFRFGLDVGARKAHNR